MSYPLGNEHEPEIHTDDENNVSICKKLNESNQYIKLWNLLCLKVNGLSAKVKELMKSNEDQMSISNLLLQKQNRNEMKMLH